MTEHVYLSTACLHAQQAEKLHGSCGSAYNGFTGEPKKPAECKYCEAKCTCPCHKETA